ncbi:unnamed protein product, partial [Closterium sp. NIES-54]
ASESALPGTVPAEALHTFTLDSGASRCFFRDSTTLTPLSAPVPARLADPSRGQVFARSSTILPCPTVPSGSLSGLHLPSFSTNLVITAALQDAMATTTTPGVLRIRSIAPPCSCRLLSHQTLLWHYRLGHPSLPRLRGMHFRLLVSGLPRSLPPLPPYLPCIEGRQRAAPRSSSYPQMTAPLQTLHMDVWGPARVSGQGRERFFPLVVDDNTRYTTVFPLRNKVMEVARTSMIHTAGPHFLWPFAVRYAAHQLNLWPRVSLEETSPTLRWTGKVGDASVFRVWVSRAFVHDTSADKLSARFIPCVFLGFLTDAPGWQFYHPTSHRVFLSQDVTFDKPVPVDPLPGNVPLEIAVGLGAAPCAASGGAEPGGAESEAAEFGCAEPRGAEPKCVEPGVGESEGAESRAARAGVFAASDTGAGGVGFPFGAGGTGSAAAAGHGGARTRGTRAAGTGSVGGAGARGAGAEDPAEPGGTRAAGCTGAGGTGVEGAGAGDTGTVDPRAGGAGAGGDVTGGTGAGGTVRSRPYFVPLLQQVLGLPSSSGLTPPLLCPPPDQSQPPLQPASPLPAPSPYTEKTGDPTEHRDPESCSASPIRAARTGRRIPRPRPPPADIFTKALPLGDHQRFSTVLGLVPTLPHLLTT